jgi:hypothetical protein
MRPHTQLCRPDGVGVPRLSMGANLFTNMEDCTHQNTETRKMSHCNQIKLQCLDCGMSVGNPIKHAAIAPEVLATIEEFDYELRDAMVERRSAIFKENLRLREQELAEESDKRREFYQNYLTTPEWREKRSMVIDRENGLCQGCRRNRIQEVHHASYQTLGDELLFQLVGLCSPCHRRAHPDK